MHPIIHIGSLALPTYGIMMLLGITAALLLLKTTSKRREIPVTDALYCAIFALIGGIVGAKALYILIELPNLIKDPSLWKYVVSGGLVFYGGALGGMLGGWLYTRRYKLGTLAMADVFAPALALGHAFGRVGCFMAGCCYGMESDSFCAVIYPPGGVAPSGVKLLPTQLFEATFLLLLAAALFVILKKVKREGTVAGWYFILYGVWRYILEFFRADPRGALGPFSTSQLISIPLVVLGLLLVFGVFKKKRRE